MESATRKNTSSQYKITYMDGGGEFDDLEARRFSTAFTHTVKRKMVFVRSVSPSLPRMRSRIKRFENGKLDFGDASQYYPFRFF